MPPDRLTPSFRLAVKKNKVQFLFVSCCPQKIQEIDPLLCAAMELCSLRGLGDLFPVESLRKTKMKLHNESKCREWKEVWEEEGRAIFCVRSRWRKRRLLG